MNIKVTKKPKNDLREAMVNHGTENIKYIHKKSHRDSIATLIIQKKRSYVKPEQLQNRTLVASPDRIIRPPPTPSILRTRHSISTTPTDTQRLLKKTSGVAYRRFSYSTNENEATNQPSPKNKLSLNLNIQHAIDHGNSVVHETTNQTRPFSARPTTTTKRQLKKKVRKQNRRPQTARSSTTNLNARELQAKRPHSKENLTKLQQSYGDKNLLETKKRYKPPLTGHDHTQSDVIQSLPLAKVPKLTRLIYTPRSTKKRKHQPKKKLLKKKKKQKLEGTNDTILSNENEWLNPLHESNLPIYNSKEGLPLNSHSLLDLKKWLQKRDEKAFNTNLSLPLHNVYCKKDTLKAYSFGEKGDEYHRYDQLDFVHDMNMYNAYARTKHAKRTKRTNIVSNIITTMSTTFERKEYTDKQV